MVFPFYQKPDSSIWWFKGAFWPGTMYRMRNLTEMANGFNRFEQKMQSHNVHPPLFYFGFFFSSSSNAPTFWRSKCVVGNKGTITTKTTNIKCNWLKWMLVVMWNVNCNGGAIIQKIKDGNRNIDWLDDEHKETVSF